MLSSSDLLEGNALKVIHICGESAVGKSYLLTEIRAIERKINDGVELNKTEDTLLARFEIIKPFTVLDKPIFDVNKQTTGLDKPDGEVSVFDLQKEVETLIHHWQYLSHSLFYYFDKFVSRLEHKIFFIWREWEKHLRDLHARPGGFGKKWTEETLKTLFVRLYDSSAL